MPHLSILASHAPYDAAASSVVQQEQMFMYAVKHNHLDTVRQLLEQGLSANMLVFSVCAVSVCLHRDPFDLYACVHFLSKLSTCTATVRSGEIQVAAQDEHAHALCERWACRNGAIAP